MLLTLAVIFLVLGLIALLLGARRIASCTLGCAKVVFIIFLVVFVALLVAHLLR